MSGSWQQRTKPRVRKLVSSCLSLVGVDYRSFIRACYAFKYWAQDRRASAGQSLGRAWTAVLDGLGIEHAFWVDGQHLEARVRQRRGRSLARWHSAVQPEARPRVLLIADSSGGFPLLLHGFLPWALWLRNVPNRIVQCDGGLPVCDAKKVTYPDTECRGCFSNKSQLMNAFGLDPIKLSQYVSPAEIEAAWQPSAA